MQLYSHLIVTVARKDARVLADLEQRREKLLEIQTEWEQLKKSAVRVLWCLLKHLADAPAATV